MSQIKSLPKNLHSWLLSEMDFASQLPKVQALIKTIKKLFSSSVFN